MNINKIIDVKMLLGFYVVLLIMACICGTVYNKFKSRGCIKNDCNIRNVQLLLSKISRYNNDYCVLIQDKDRNIINIDSLFNGVKSSINDSLFLIEIDTLYKLIELKKKYNSLIRQNIRNIEINDSLIYFALSDVLNKEEVYKTITRKKKGLAGMLGIKETMKIPLNNNNFNNKLIVYNKEKRLLKKSTDSLLINGGTLSQRINELIYIFNTKLQNYYKIRNERLVESQKVFFVVFASALLLALILLIFFLLIIRNDTSKQNIIKYRLKQVIKENEELLEMRKKIILTISHDIRGPLGNINNCVDLVSETKGKKKRELYIDDIRYSCNHILHLVNNLMDAYRINEVGVLRNDTPFMLTSFLERISKEFSRKANLKALMFHCEHKNKVSKIKGDADKLEQILTNILTNAIKYTHTGSIFFNLITAMECYFLRSETQVLEWTMKLKNGYLILLNVLLRILIMTVLV